MLRTAGLATLFVLSAGSAYAGCANYTDGSISTPPPRAVICLDGSCEETVMEYECGSAQGVQIGYANGLLLSYEDSSVKAYRNEKPVDLSKVTCKDIDESACRFPD